MIQGLPSSITSAVTNAPTSFVDSSEPTTVVPVAMSPEGSYAKLNVATVTPRPRFFVTKAVLHVLTCGVAWASITLGADGAVPIPITETSPLFFVIASHPSSLPLSKSSQKKTCGWVEHQVAAPPAPAAPPKEDGHTLSPYQFDKKIEKAIGWAVYPADGLPLIR